MSRASVVLSPRFWIPIEPSSDCLGFVSEGTSFTNEAGDFACIGLAVVPRRATGLPYDLAGTRRPLICLSNLGDENGNAGRHRRTSVPQAVLERLRDIMADVFASEFASNGHPDPITLNRPFIGGHITRHYSAGGLWVVQIELSKDLYLHPSWFDPTSRSMDDGRLSDLNAMVRTALAELARSPGLS